MEKGQRVIVIKYADKPHGIVTKFTRGEGTGSDVYEVRLDDGMFLLCWPYQLEAE